MARIATARLLSVCGYGLWESRWSLGKEKEVYSRHFGSPVV